MFDALQDTPSDFQFKLMDALNSLGQTMEIPPIECFDKVLCASDDENPDVKKTMYNWWRAFFEVLGKCDKMPKDRETEFKQKVDALMAEIMKAGDKEASGDNEVVLEDGYEAAPKAEEDEMNKNFDFAVQHIGEIAHKVKDIVNFVNPYCETKEVYNTMKKTNERGGFGLEPDWEDLPDDWGSWNNYDGDEDDEGYDMDSDDYEMSDDEKSDAWRSRHKYLEKGNNEVWVPMKEIIGTTIGESDWGGKSTTRTLNFTKWEVDGLMDYIAEEIAHLEDEASGLNIMGIVPKRILEYIELKGFASSVKKLDPKEVIIKWADGSGVEDDFAPAKGNSKSVYDLVKDIYEGDSEYSESEVALESDWDEKPAEREEAHDKPERGTKAIVNGHVVDADSGYAEFMRIANMEPRRRHWEENSEEDKPDEVKDGEKKFKTDGETKTLVTGSDKENNNKREVTEMTIEQEVSNPWSLAELMWGQGKENLEDLLRAEVVDEEVLMQMLEDMDIHNLTALNDAFAFDFESILEMVGCDPHAWSQNLEIKKAGVDSEED